MTTEIVLEALQNAIQDQKPDPGLIVHTDLGTQYTSEAFQKLLKNMKWFRHLVEKDVHMTTLVLNLFMPY